MIPLGAKYMMLSAFGFSVMSVLVKLAGQRLPSEEIVLFRAIISLFLSYGLLARAGISVWGTHRRMLLLRGVLGCISLHCVFFSFTHLPIAEATVIQYLYPIFTAIFAAVILGEAVGPRLLVAIVLGAFGVIAVARPGPVFGSLGAALEPAWVAIAICGAFLSSCAYIIVRRLASKEHPLVIVFYFPLVTVPLALPRVIANWVPPVGWEWPCLLGVGIFTQMGQVYLTRGLEQEPAARAAALSYLQVVFATLWGILIFANIPSVWTIAGAALILLGAYINVRDKPRPVRTAQPIAVED